MREQEKLFGSDGRFLGFIPPEVVELCERFVENRFAEEQSFMRKDVEMWLQDQSSGSCDTGDPLWGKIFGLINREGIPDDRNLLEILREVGARLTGTLESEYLLPREWKSPQASFGWIAKVLAGSPEAETYLHHDGVLVILGHGTQVCVFEPDQNGRGTFRSTLLRSDVAFSALFARQYLYATHVGQLAGDFIWRCAEHCIAKVREKAEAEFDSAIAVGLDSKIVHADSVWEIHKPGQKGQTVTVRSARHFESDKVFLHPKFSKISSPSDDPREVQAYLSQMGFPGAFPQILLRVGKEMVFVTRSEFIPPLG